MKKLTVILCSFLCVTFAASTARAGFDVVGILGVIAFGILVLVVVLALPGIIAGIGLLNRWGWARILALIIGFFSLFEVPFGTALGIYTFWVLLQDDPAVKFSCWRYACHYCFLHEPTNL